MVDVVFHDRGALRTSMSGAGSSYSSGRAVSSLSLSPAMSHYSAPSYPAASFIGTRPAFAAPDEYHRFHEPGAALDTQGLRHPDCMTQDEEIIVTKFPDSALHPHNGRSATAIQGAGLKRKRKPGEDDENGEMDGWMTSSVGLHSDLGAAMAPGSGVMGKRGRKMGRTMKNGGLAPGPAGIGSPTVSGGPTQPGSTCRYDSSLGGGRCNWDEVTADCLVELAIPRMGVGGNNRSSDSRDDTAGAQCELDQLLEEDKRLDDSIREMHEKIRQFSDDEQNKPWLYVTEEDIKSLPCFQKETVFAIKAPHGTILEVPDPDESAEYPRKRYQVFLRSTAGPIELYLLSQFDERIEEVQNPMEVPVPAMPVMSSADGTAQSSITNVQFPSPSPVHAPQCDGQNGEEVGTSRREIGASPTPRSPSSDFGNGMLRITTTDVNVDMDYWLSSGDTSITTMFCDTAAQGTLWDDVVKMNSGVLEYNTVEKGSQQPTTTPPSADSGAGETDAPV
ncbi:hypothetical protein CBR_g54574 [Chara braunii]|uniref:E2F transcription factor CC-MB domain-containing protein n=1 Tax=Chara braunii TaxID=69332 RepID=A0A388MC89_CHABU|nr:hypothetical protein CBR_g54574 [Chara braunii]|eukprot:GBG92177.1 hypothetical protein CBR_g54574 [Chara braunii]